MLDVVERINGRVKSQGCAGAWLATKNCKTQKIKTSIPPALTQNGQTSGMAEHKVQPTNSVPA